jgi:hypothetical protein
MSKGEITTFTHSPDTPSSGHLFPPTCTLHLDLVLKGSSGLCLVDWLLRSALWLKPIAPATRVRENMHTQYHPITVTVYLS